jgi:ribosomal protein S18 acetylase RimI-like enzyme
LRARRLSGLDAGVQIRRAVHKDCGTIARLAGEAAAEEGAQSSLDLDRVRAHGFGQSPLFEVWLAQERNSAPAIGQAVIAKSYDFRRAAPNVVLCELYVVPAARRSGLARKLMSCVARRARDLGARELVIATGVDNEVAQRFFAAVGAQRRDTAVFMMSADGIEWLAAESL